MKDRLPPAQLSDAAKAARSRELIRAEALARFARWRPDGKSPLLCEPPQKIRAERRARGLPPLKRKVIFNSVEDANAFAELVRITGDGPSRAYVCPFSRHGHAHLTGDQRYGAPAA